MKYITLSLTLSIVLTFTPAEFLLAQTVQATSTKKVFFQSLLSTSKNFFQRIFASKDKIVIPQQESSSSGQISPQNPTTTPQKLNIQQGKIDTKSLPARELSDKKIVSNPTSGVSLQKLPETSSKPPTVIPFSNVELELSVKSGGNVFSSENGISCYSNEVCKKDFISGKKIVLQASPTPGYQFTGWSEASCGKAATCAITLTNDMEVVAYFKVVGPDKRTGKILSPKEGETCYIPLGEDKCNMALTWQSDAGLDMTIKADGGEYYVSVEADNMFPKISGANPGDVDKAKAEHADGLVYFPFFVGEYHELTILHKTEIMDSVKFKVVCAPGLYWDGRKCWEKNAKILYVFKDQYAVITSEPAGIICGYRPDKCSTGFSNGTKVTLKVMPQNGHIFDGWTGACSGTETTCILTMDSDKSVGVKFKQ